MLIIANIRIWNERRKTAIERFKRFELKGTTRTDCMWNISLVLIHHSFYSNCGGCPWYKSQKHLTRRLTRKENWFYPKILLDWKRNKKLFHENDKPFTEVYIDTFRDCHHLFFKLKHALKNFYPFIHLFYPATMERKTDKHVVQSFKNLSHNANKQILA